jgi:Cu+-exporting ATPase
MRQAEGETVVYVAINGKASGIIGLKDKVKPSARAALADLARRGVKVIMATGDNAATAAAVGRELGIGDIHAGLLPEDKALLVADVKKRGAHVAMAGDGINDAPALMAADVGIAMATGTDVAMESAGITLVKGDLAGIARALNLSSATMRNIRQNLTFAFLYNTIGIPVAAGIFFPLFGWVLSPMIAAAAMSLSSVSVIANSLRLQSAKI